METVDSSYVSTPQTKEPSYDTVYDRMKLWKNKFPDKPALVGYTADKSREMITFKDLYDTSMNVSTYLLENGLQSGDLVGICVNNSIAAAQMILGVIFAGGHCFFMTSEMADGSDIIESVKEYEIMHICFDSVPAKLFANSLLAADTCPELKVVICANDDSLKTVHERATSLTDVINRGYDITRIGEVTSTDIALYFRTSGSTGPPKAVGISHFHLLNNTDNVNERFGLDQDSVWFCDRPFGWGLGSLRTVTACGCTRVFVDTKLSLMEGHIDTLCDIIDAEDCTHVFLPSYLVTDLLDRPDLSAKFSKVININCSGERIPRKYTTLLGKFCRELCFWYGIQEALGVTCFSSADPDDYEDGIAGRPYAGISVKIVNDKGEVVPRWESGEILLSTPYIFKAYRGMPEKYEASFDAHGWSRTGDIGHLRPDGNLIVDGRETDQIFMGTIKYFPQPIEKEISQCHGVMDVVVVPVPDRRLQNVFCACVIMKPGHDETGLETVKAFCDVKWSSEMSGSTLSTKPHYYLLYNNFPVKSTGKLDRKALAKDAKEKLGL